MADEQPTSVDTIPTHMRAFVSSRFGAPHDVLTLDDQVPLPAPPIADRVHIRVHAAATHGGDWRLIRGEPYILRLMFGRVRVPGCELAGVVTAVGVDVTRVRVGDRVLADASEDGFGAFADYVVVRDIHVAKIADSVSFASAAAAPVSALAALQAVRQVGGLSDTDAVLVTGASGGVGHFAVQLAHRAGASVTAVCSEGKADAVRALGADAVVSATELQTQLATADAGGTERSYTVVIAAACYAAPAGLIRGTMRRGGRYVLVGGETAFFFRTMALARWMQWRLGVSVGVLASAPNAKDLDELAGMLEREEIVPCVHCTFGFEQLVDAIEFLESRKVTGKVVVAFMRDSAGQLNSTE